MNKDKLIDLLNDLKTDLDYYKNKPHFIKLIENLIKKNKIIENYIENFEKTLSEDTDYSNDIKNIERYIKKFKKKYLEKVELSDGVIYKYEFEYRYYPNKKSIHIENFFKDKFLKNYFDEIVIDNLLRPDKTFSNDLLQDIKNSQSCYIIIKF